MISRIVWSTLVEWNFHRGRSISFPHVWIYRSLRSPDEEEFQQLDQCLLDTRKTRKPCALGWSKVRIVSAKHSPSLMSENVQSAFAEACDGLRLIHRLPSSGAGHEHNR